MNYGVHNNLALMNANRQLKINTGNKAKSSEKLSTGYRINRSADDAAGLSISEKLRQQVRGLDRGTLNGQEGVSWVQTGDGALEEVHALLQRMRELTIQSLNDTNTPADRAACQMEFDQLQSEVDRITKTTQFNTQEIFAQHELPYYQCEGNVVWNQSQLHVVSPNQNDLTIKYRDTLTDAVTEVSFTVPIGEYTTQELIDEMEDAIIANGLDEKGIMFEFTERGTCNLNLEGGEIIDAVGGGLSYLLYDMYSGGGFGALVGTTTFLSEYAVLDIVTGQNDTMTFDIESFSGGGTQKVSLTIPQGSYTRSQLINMLNGQLAGTDVTATEYGSGIKLAGANSIVTGFKGNMFKIDPESNNNDVYHSVFYDNVSWGTVNMNAAVFTGGYVKPTSDLSTEYAEFDITADNNELTFIANGSATPVTITIPPKSYTVNDMVTKLDELFAQAGLELDASDEVSGGYKRIVITSKVKGATSKVGIDTSSSAYETLFVKRTYNKQVEEPTSGRETRDDCLAKVTGAKQFTTGTAEPTLPLEITAGKNDIFTLTLKDANGAATNYDITLNPNVYDTIGAIRAEINAQLQAQGIDSLVKAEISGTNTIELIALNGSGLTGVEVKEHSGNAGYNDLFVKTTITYTQVNKTGTGTPKTITLDKVLTDPMTFPDGDNTLKVKVNGQDKIVTFPPNQQMTQAEILQKINQKLQAEPPVTVQNSFSRVEGIGTESSNHFDTTVENGQTTINHKSYSNTGTSSVSQGTVGGYDNNKAATITLNGCTIPAYVDTTNGNNYLELNINNVEYKITLEEGIFSRNDFVNKLQSAIDKKVADYYGADYIKGTNGKCFGGATVSLDGNNQLVITSRLNYPNGDIGGGKYTSLSCNTTDSSLLKKLHTTEKSASVTSDIALKDSITITDDTNTFSFWFGDGDSPYSQVTITLDKGNYSRSAFISELNKKLSTYDVTATLNTNGTFTLATEDVGNDTGIRYYSKDAGTSVEAIFGKMITEKAATGTANCDIQEEIVIKADGSNDDFHVLVSDSTGAYQSVDITLAPGTYDRNGFVAMLNGKLAGTGLTVELDSTGRKLTYTTDAVGKNAKFVVEYSSGGSSMLAIYGEREVEQPGVIASVDPSGKLVLTGTGGVTSLNMTSAPNNTFLASIPNTKTEKPIKTDGYASNKKAYIAGASLTEPITITSLNNVFKFTYVDGETAGILNKKDINITLAENNYTFSELKDALEAAINTQAGADEVIVTVDANGVRLEAAEPGSKHYFELSESQAGGFYHRVMHRIEKKMDTLSAGENRNNLQKMEPAYTVGRKDIANGTTVVRTGINDTLTLDFTYGAGNTTSFTVVLPPGEYGGTALVNVLQEKLDEQMEAAGYDAGMIEVGIGGVDSKVDGSNDDVALVFKLANSDKVKLPGNGTYIIDGVRGNAAFSIFYQTEGEMEPAYITGSKDVSKGVTIKPGETELSFKVDDTSTYTISLAEGDYTAEELIDEINAKIPGNAPVVAELHNNSVRLMYTTLGEHKISDVHGSAKEEIFFQENGEIGERKGVMIQLSSQRGNDLEIAKNIVNTSYLGINSVAITRPKYANKALVRLDEAISRVSEVRSEMGSIQNRLEYSIANNENTSENTQAAESRIRDTDMAEEMVKNARYNILQQVTESMMAQGKVSAEGVLRLLQ